MKVGLGFRVRIRLRVRFEASLIDSTTERFLPRFSPTDNLLHDFCSLNSDDR